MAAVIVVGALVLVEVHAWLSGPNRDSLPLDIEQHLGVDAEVPSGGRR